MSWANHKQVMGKVWASLEQENCLKGTRKLPEGCQKVASKLQERCQKVVSKLSEICQKVARKMPDPSSFVTWLWPHTKHRANTFLNNWAKKCSTLWDLHQGTVLQSLLRFFSYMTFAWLSHDFRMTFLWIFHDFLMTFLWLSCNFLVTFLQLSGNFPPTF